MSLLLENLIARNLNDHFEDLFNSETSPVKRNLICAVYSVICDDRYQSLRRLSNNYYNCFSGKSKSSLYYLFSGTEYSFPCEWNKQILIKALSIIPQEYYNHPIFLSIDDTIVEKYGTEFEKCSDIYDHNKNAFVNGYALLSLVMTIVTKTINGYSYIKVPLGFKTWIPKKELSTKEQYQSKFDIYFKWLNEIIEFIGQKKKIIILCDAWYTKGQIVDLYHKYNNVEIIGAINKSTKLYLLPPERTAGAKGRKPQKGRRLTTEDLVFESIPGEKLQFTHQEVKSQLFGLDTTLQLFVTKSKNDTERYFICTDKNISNYVEINLIKKTNSTSNNLLSYNIKYLPFALYTLRWNIETFFYEIKKFWGLESFMVRGFKAIYRLINFLSVIYASMTLLPYLCKDFLSLQGGSPQEVRSHLGGFLRKLHFIVLIGEPAQQHKMPNGILNYLTEIGSCLKIAC